MGGALKPRLQQFKPAGREVSAMFCKRHMRPTVCSDRMPFPTFARLFASDGFMGLALYG